MLGGGVGGVVQILYNADEAERIQGQLHTIRTCIEEATPVMESKRLTQILKETTLKDPMTGLYNRRFLEEFSFRLTSSAERRESGLSLLMCDLDAFKQMNDAYGHAVGDLALREVVRVISSSVRHSDLVIRMGGDEFLAVLADSSADKAMEVAERIRSSLEANRFAVDSGTFRLTVSLGVSIYPADSENFEDCMRAADAALYRAKEAGRNKVVRFSREMLRS
jgi:diguanylate cyclase (GGDEF)-like protein